MQCAELCRIECIVKHWIDSNEVYESSALLLKIKCGHGLTLMLRHGQHTGRQLSWSALPSAWEFCFPEDPHALRQKAAIPV